MTLSRKFAAAVCGLVAAFSLVALLSVGLFVFPAALACTLAILAGASWRQVAGVALLGVSAGAAFLAWFSRHGPGTWCSPDGFCQEHLLNPWAVLAVSVVALGGGLALVVRGSRPASSVGAHWPDGS